ncbi:MAG: polyribonucleotide nucleotidyltransferase [Candidatus Levybacteria bacterium]|nr:polyribonucleotide nucleotidyltransferase [Candidatus Levybacteria bacterium]
MAKTSLSFDIAGKTLTVETGQLASQATASILARLGDTMVLATVVEGKKRDDMDYFPLTVEYVERLYAGGRIKGSRWVKREGRPSDDAILTARLIDRSIRPLFPKDYRNEVQIMVTILSVDGENEPDILSMIAVSAALSISHIPWQGPIGAIRIGYVKEKDNGNAELIVNPTTSESEYSELDLVVAQTKDKTVMIETGALQIPEEILVDGIRKAHEETKKIITFIDDFVAKIGQKKAQVSVDSKIPELAKLLEKTYSGEIKELLTLLAKKEGENTAFAQLVDTIFEHREAGETYEKRDVTKAVEYLLFSYLRSDVLTKKKRIDGRKIDQIRDISLAVSVLPRTHGSAIFQRGSTQALTVVTLGSPRMEQLIESAEGEEAKRYMHHYSMPPYSVGETGRTGFPSRREIGHGALAEKALIAVIPHKTTFPYTVRVVSEILSSNGSTSMALKILQEIWILK